MNSIKNVKKTAAKISVKFLPETMTQTSESKTECSLMKPRAEESLNYRGVAKTNQSVHHNAAKLQGKLQALSNPKINRITYLEDPRIIVIIDSES